MRDEGEPDNRAKQRCGPGQGGFIDTRKLRQDKWGGYARHFLVPAEQPPSCSRDPTPTAIAHGLDQNDKFSQNVQIPSVVVASLRGFTARRPRQRSGVPTHRNRTYP